MAVNERIRSVNERFKQLHVNCDYEWLSGCVQYFYGDSPMATIEQLFDKAYEQWQLSLLKDSGCPCLPNSIFTEKQSHMITGTFPLQLQYLIDIAESAYDQLQKLHNKQLDEGKEQQEFLQTQAPTQQRNGAGAAAKAKRVLKLELFDGQRSVTAMEYRPIPCLSTNLPPGTKVMLSGPIRCVNHVLLLEAKNIKLLGGEVETLLIQNAFENVLLRKLNRPLNPNPKTNNAEDPAVIENGIAERPILPRIPMTQTQSTAAIGDILDDDFDDELLLAVDSVQLPLPLPQQQNQVQQARRQENDNDNDSFGDLDDSALLQIDELSARLIEPTHTATTSARDSSNARPTTHNVDRLLPTAVVMPQRNVSICDDSYPFKIRGINFVFIKELAECPESEKLRRRFFMVKALIIHVKENAQVKRDHWSLGVILKESRDEIGEELQVRFHNDVLEKLTDHTAAEIHEMNAARKSRPQVNEEILRILAKLKDCLASLHCYMKIEYTSESEYPIVLDIITPTTFLDNNVRGKKR